MRRNGNLNVLVQQTARQQLGQTMVFVTFSRITATLFETAQPIHQHTYQLGDLGCWQFEGPVITREDRLGFYLHTDSRFHVLASCSSFKNEPLGVHLMRMSVPLPPTAVFDELVQEWTQADCACKGETQH